MLKGDVVFVVFFIVFVVLLLFNVVFTNKRTILLAMCRKITIFVTEKKKTLVQTQVIIPNQSYQHHNEILTKNL